MDSTDVLAMSDIAENGLDLKEPEIPDDAKDNEKEIYKLISQINKKHRKVFIYFKNAFSSSKYDATFKKKIIQLFTNYLNEIAIISSALGGNKKYFYTLSTKDIQLLTFEIDDDTVNKLKLSDFIITIYASSQLQDLNIDIYDDYVDKYTKHLQYNNYGKDNLKIRNFDNTLSSRKTSLSDFFINFNKNNGFEYKSIKIEYQNKGDLYLSQVKKYDEVLENLISYIDTYILNNELKALASMGIFYVLQNYWGILIIIILVLALITMYILILANFFASIYYRFVSLDKINAYESHYYGFDNVYQVGGFYLDYPNLIFLGIYIIFFILFIPINLLYISEYFKGNIRILGCSTIFNKHVDVGIYPFINLYMLFIFVNIAYYIYILSLSNSYKIIHDNHNSIQDLIYDNVDNELLKFLYEEKVIVDNIELFQVYDKLNHWSYNGNKQQNDSRVGNIENAEEMINKRFKILITSVLATHYINNRNQSEIVSDKNLGSIKNYAKRSIFMFSKKDTPILPAFSDVKNTDMFKVIMGPLLKLKYRKCAVNDEGYFCTNKTKFENNIYKMRQEDLNKLKDKYNKLKADINVFVAKIKENENVLTHKISIIFASIFLVFYILMTIQVIAWITVQMSIFNVLKRKKENMLHIFLAYVFVVFAL